MELTKVDVKVCSVCRIEKEATPDYFHRNKGTKDGLTGQCKECVNSYRKENRDRINKRKREIYHENPDIQKESNRKWQKENREHWNRLTKNNMNKKRARDNGLTHDLTLDEWLETLEHFEYKCAYCGIHQDEHALALGQEHVLPISKGGGHTVDNVVPSCKSCNSSKRSEEVFTWMRTREHYSIGREQKIREFIGGENK